MKRLLIVLVLLAAMLTAACSGPAHNKADMSAVQDKLNVLDVYKESVQKNQTNPDTTAENISEFSFGMSREMIRAMETLPLSTEYTDALDYSGSGIYGYDMMLTYWFNADNQLESISYSMWGNKYLETVNSLMASLRSDYGEPSESGFYDSNDSTVTFADDTKIMQAVDADGVYYYAAFKNSSGIDIELFARQKDAGYDFWVYFTDYNYYKK